MSSLVMLVTKKVCFSLMLQLLKLFISNLSGPAAVINHYLLLIRTYR